VKFSQSSYFVESLKEDLVKNLKIDLFVEAGLDDDQVQAVIDEIDSYPEGLRQKVFALCLSISYARASLVVNALKHIRDAAIHLDHRELERWVGTAVTLLDQGLAASLDFLSGTDRESMMKFKSLEGLYLEESLGTLETYLRGISGRELRIEPHEESFTDTDTVYLPRLLAVFKDNRKNFALMELTVAHKWAQIAQGTLVLSRRLLSEFVEGAAAARPDIETLFSRFAERQLALDLYNIIEAFRLEHFLRKELPGLMREAETIREELLPERPSLETLSEREAFVEGLYHYFLARSVKGPMPPALEEALTSLSRLKASRSPRESLNLLHRFYEIASHLKGGYDGRPPIAYLGTIKPEKVSLCIRMKRESLRKRLESVIKRITELTDVELEPRYRISGETAPGEKPVQREGEYLLVKGKLFEVDEELKEIIQDMGGVPEGILMDGSSVKEGTTFASLRDILDREEGEVQGEGIKYDEWDYRRGDYKKAWCSLFETDIHPGHEPFVEMTLNRYWGYVKVLRRKFELLRREPRLLRRQKDGDDIDIDAVVEAFSDMRAGIAPAENVFVKVDRQERNIAALFLLDMSGSTKGWVNQAEKEALVLMCEALDALGDRYAIYGFSGMTRNKIEYYRIKGFEEPYDSTVKQRIAGITPKDYTRMGPPVRHSTRMLNSIDARTKLLIVLSDGKPEDWDAYKGVYSIEDSRRALIEAKEEGIHVFCITIDKQAASYITHLFGEVNYIFLDDVRKLPNKITEIYRRITT
jgi:nitric oxide reductase NorD protein